MCGIIGYIGPKNSLSVVIDGLKRLEYRGYDSAGIAFIEEGSVKTVRSAGKISRLEGILEEKAGLREKFSGAVIGHTRWATHGGPSEKNAHPHKSGSIVLVHNGIIENYQSLKKKLKSDGFEFSSETDTEVICHLINLYSRKLPFEESVRAAVGELRGAYALAIMHEAEPWKIIGVKKDSPLVLGAGEGEFFISSDASAFIAHTNKALFLDDGEMAVVTPEGFTIVSVESGEPAAKNKKTCVLPFSQSMAEKSGHKHFMLKEIHEQPRAVADTIRGRLAPGADEVNLEEFGLTPDDLKAVRKVVIIACGTSWHAGLAGKYMIEQMARIPVEVDIASEFRYRDPILKADELFIAITQSGETADTLAALKLARKSGARTLAITNVMGSTVAREAGSVFFTRGGPEIGVASTKTFMTQMAGLYLLAMAAARAKGEMAQEQFRELAQDLMELPAKIESILSRKQEVEKIARGHFKKEHFLFLGRGIDYPVALEGALKLKEISYIHAEGYPAGEMKHGPIALIDEDMPALFLLPLQSALKEKILSNMEEVRSRNATILLVTDGEDKELEAVSNGVFIVPASNRFLGAALRAVPLQLLAYYIGILRGCDVDQPRNLAKSVTVE